MDFTLIDELDYKAVPLLRLTNNKLVLNEINLDTSQKYKVVSVIGKPNTGKSTFLNLLISHLNNEDIKVFNHIDQGIDIYVQDDVIFLNCEEIENTHNVQLIELIYRLSTLIICNDSKLMATFESIHNDVKPDLLIRFRDCDSNFESNCNIDKSLNDIFSSVDIISTNTLDRSELKDLRLNNFLNVIESKDNNFLNCFIDIINKMTNVKSMLSNEFLTVAQIIVDKLNKDITNAIMMTSLTQELDEKMKQLINVDETQKYLDDNVVPVEHILKNISDLNKLKYKESTITLMNYSQNIINSVKTESKKLAKDKLVNFENFVKNLINDYMVNYSKYYFKMKNEYLEKFNALKDNVKDQILKYNNINSFVFTETFTQHMTQLLKLGDSLFTIHLEKNDHIITIFMKLHKECDALYKSDFTKFCVNKYGNCHDQMMKQEFRNMYYDKYFKLLTQKQCVKLQSYNTECFITVGEYYNDFSSEIWNIINESENMNKILNL
jgi:hypothetical protein